ncbi:hypothetical protein IA69_12565 [Massilia sp. JS1662]|nr:hypothetical protein [Massilia sp. JS1662]KGF81479.1 hypothetical protein IA69_12565 [Massilia sp. JS1662]
MSIIDDCVQFLEDLILGDFNEQQMVSAQVIGGLISLVPIVDQVMDVRDVSGSLYRINKHGGFAKATLDQKIDFGFAAFGVVPEVGSAFKTVFKPLYKQRKAAKGVINGGVAMIERMLGQKKGGAVRWVRALDWAGNTQAAIVQANLALSSCIALLEYLGQGHWWCPDHLEQLARDTAPGLESMRGKLEAPIREASAEIRAFLEDMLGEHAAAVALAVANHAAVMRPGHASAASQKTTSGRRTTAHAQVGAQARTQGKAAQGKIASAVQKTTWELYRGLNYAVKGLMGEHIVDHHVIEKKNWGLQWNKHDMISPTRGTNAGGWQNDYRKINDGGIPLYLCTPSSHVLTSGIDSLWFTNRPAPHQYAVVEAKANMNPQASLYQLLGEANKMGVSAASTAGNVRNRGGTRTTSARPKEKAKVMQMSRDWIDDRIDRDFRSIRRNLAENYSRHVFLVTPLQVSGHLLAMEKIVSESLVNDPKGAQKYASMHDEHDVQKEFGEAHLDEALKKYQAEGKYRRPKKN